MNKSHSKVKVLIVDDSDVIRESLEQFFFGYNFTVKCCQNGMDGIKLAFEFKPDIIFLDLVMPTLDGFKMLQLLKLIDDVRGIPVVVISGNTNKSNVIASIEAGAEQVLTKPLEKEKLIKCVNNVLKGEYFKIDNKPVKFSQKDSDDLVFKLRRQFLNGFGNKRRSIISALDKKNTELLKAVIHEIKGAGGTIGLPNLSSACADIEHQIISKGTDWDLLKSKCNQVLSIVKELEQLNT